MSAVATAGVAAWVVPEILTAKPAAGATLSVVGAGDVPVTVTAVHRPAPPGSTGPTGVSTAPRPGRTAPRGVNTAPTTGASTAPTSGVIRLPRAG